MKLFCCNFGRYKAKRNLYGFEAVTFLFLGLTLFLKYFLSSHRGPVFQEPFLECLLRLAPLSSPGQCLGWNSLFLCYSQSHSSFPPSHSASCWGKQLIKQSHTSVLMTKSTYCSLGCLQLRPWGCNGGLSSGETGWWGYNFWCVLMPLKSYDL